MKICCTQAEGNHWDKTATHTQELGRGSSAGDGTADDGMTNKSMRLEKQYILELVAQNG